MTFLTIPLPLPLAAGGIAACRWRYRRSRWHPARRWRYCRSLPAVIPLAAGGRPSSGMYVNITSLAACMSSGIKSGTNILHKYHHNRQFTFNSGKGKRTFLNEFRVPLPHRSTVFSPSFTSTLSSNPRHRSSLPTKFPLAPVNFSSPSLTTQCSTLLGLLFCFTLTTSVVLMSKDLVDAAGF